MMGFKKLLLGAILIGAAGCEPGGPVISEISGHYEGSLTTKLDGIFKQITVRTDIPDGAPTGPVVVTDSTGKAVFTLELSEVKSDSVTVRGSLGMSQPVALALGPECYAGASGIQVTLCASKPEVTFEIQDASGVSLVSLVLYHFQSEAPLPQENPRAFTLDQAIDRARTMSFTSKIEFEHVVQAKAAVRAAYLNLLPHISMGTIANNLTPSFSGILGAIGDLAPFLLPSRWLGAGQAADLSRAELDSMKLMRLDSGAQIEGMFYGYQRDRVTRDFYVTTLKKAATIRDEVKIGEDLGLLAAGSTDNMNSTVNQIEQSLEVMDQVLSADLAALSQSLGYFNPLVVTEAQITGETIPIEGAPKLAFDAVNEAALNRSFELDQMDDLIDAAHKAKDAKYFSWLDPAGDPSLGLGFALPSQIEVSSSQIRELGIDRDQLKSVISQKVFNAVSNYHQALQTYALASEGVGIQERLLNQASIDIERGTRVDLFGLVQIFQNYLNVQIQREAARASYRVARSQIDRLLLQGYYAKF